MPTVATPRRRRPKNHAEGLFYDRAGADGWDVCKRGWPDFVLERDGRMVAVEVKPDGEHHLRHDQRRVLRWLSGHGVECYVWTPTEGFTPASRTAKTRHGP